MRAALTGVVLLAATLPAQQTWIVDQRGTGHFTDLAPAIAAAAPGDVLLIRGGGFFIGTYAMDKALALRADGPRPWITQLNIGNFLNPIGNLVSVRGIDFMWVELLPSIPMPVALEDITTHTLVARFCAALSLLRSSCGSIGASWWFGTMPGITLVNTPTTISQCSIRGGDSWCDHTLPNAARPGLRVSGSNVEVSHTAIRGGDGQSMPCGVANAGEGVRVESGNVRLSSCVVQGGTAFTGGPVPPATIWSGTLTADPSTQFLGGASVATIGFVPATTGQGAVPGGTVAYQLTCADPSPLPALIVASVGVRIPVPMSPGYRWIDLDNAVLMAIGPVSSANPLTGSFVVPSAASRGLAATIQGAVAHPATGVLTVATPVIVLVH